MKISMLSWRPLLRLVGLGANPRISLHVGIEGFFVTLNVHNGAITVYSARLVTALLLVMQHDRKESFAR